MTKRYDRLEIRNDVFETSGGFLKGHAVVTRTGVFTYVNDDGSLRKELRHPNHVFKKDALKTLEMIPMTLRHPKDFVDSKNSDSLQVGNTGETVEIDGHLLSTSLIINRQDAIDAVMNSGMLELSLGYETDLIEESGEYDGERYDFIQTNIICNHLAIVEKARAGSVARIKLDGVKDYAIQRLDSENIKTDSINPKGEKPKMAKFHVDGVEMEIDNIDVAATHFNNQNKKIDEALKGIAALTTTTETLTANFDAEKIRADAAETALVTAQTDIKIRNDAAELTALKTDVTAIMGKDYKFDGKDIPAIKNDVIAKAYPEIKLDGQGPDYLKAMYDTAVVSLRKNKDGVGNQLKETITPSADASFNFDAAFVPTGDPVIDAKGRMDSVYKNAYKNPDMLNAKSAELALKTA